MLRHGLQDGSKVTQMQHGTPGEALCLVILQTPLQLVLEPRYRTIALSLGCTWHVDSDSRGDVVVVIPRLK